ncbi:hypothetical protein PG984_015672 [Apiospora sp. TS-2023a]
MYKPGGSVVHEYNLAISLSQSLRCFHLAVALWLYVAVALDADINAAPAGDAATAQFSTLPLTAISSLSLKDSTTSTSATGVTSSVGPAGSTAASSVPDNGGAGGSLSTEANIGLGLSLGIGIPLITVLCFFLWRRGGRQS